MMIIECDYNNNKFHLSNTWQSSISYLRRFHSSQQQIQSLLISIVITILSWRIRYGFQFVRTHQSNARTRTSERSAYVLYWILFQTIHSMGKWVAEMYDDETLYELLLPLCQYNRSSWHEEALHVGVISAEAPLQLQADDRWFQVFPLIETQCTWAILPFRTRLPFRLNSRR